MSDMSDSTPDLPPSLILAAEDSKRLDQPLFFPDFAEDGYSRMEVRGEFTGERLFARDPKRYTFIVSLLAEGTIPDAYIAQLVNVSRNTINSIRDRERIPIEQEKERILKNVRTGLRMVTERIVELAPTMTARDAIIAAGVLAEKMQLLSGEATTIIQHAGEKVQHADFNALLAALPAADVTELEMGSSARADEQKAGDAVPVPAVPGDSESSVQQSESSRSNVQGNKPAPADLDPVGSDQQGGRGSAYGEGEENPN